MVATLSHSGAPLSCRTPAHGAYPVGRAVPSSYAFWWCVSMGHVHLQSFAVSNFLRVSKSNAQHRFFPHLEQLIHRFSTNSPSPLLNNPLPRGYAWNACFFCFAYPLLRNDFFNCEVRIPGSSGRVTQVFALSPATRPVPYLAKDILILQSKARSCKKFPG